jgi:hypothetical protein
VTLIVMSTPQQLQVSKPFNQISLLTNQHAQQSQNGHCNRSVDQGALCRSSQSLWPERNDAKSKIKKRKSEKETSESATTTKWAKKRKRTTNNGFTNRDSNLMVLKG